jgi:cyclopropane-fatty-acyl-phospholipid synthase
MKRDAGYRGASTSAIQYHYDAGNAFYRLWLDPSLTYSCALWEEGEPDEALEAAQRRKLDFHIRQARAEGMDRVLDIGCGWGSLARRLVTAHNVRTVVALTLSAAQAEWVRDIGDARIDIREENWFDHVPSAPYDALLSVASFEAFAKPDLSEAERAAAYRTFFERCHRWLRSGGWMSLQTIAWGTATREASSQFIERQIFPDSDLPTLAELAKATDQLFEVVALRNDRLDYARTARVWLSRLKAERGAAVETVGEETVARYEKYLKLAWIAFHTGKLHLYRLTLRRADDPRT